MCDNTNCFNFDPNQQFMLCRECLTEMFEEEPIENIYELFTQMQEMLGDEGGFIRILKTLHPDCDKEPDFKEEINQLKENLFDVFNEIFLSKARHM